MKDETTLFEDTADFEDEENDAVEPPKAMTGGAESEMVPRDVRRYAAAISTLGGRKVFGTLLFFCWILFVFMIDVWHGLTAEKVELAYNAGLMGLASYHGANTLSKIAEARK